MQTDEIHIVNYPINLIVKRHLSANRAKLKFLKCFALNVNM